VVAEIIQTSSEWIKQAILLTATAQDNKKIHQGHLSFLILSLKQNNSFFLSKRNIYFIDSKLNSTILYSLYRITSASNALLERPTGLPIIDLRHCAMGMKGRVVFILLACTVEWQEAWIQLHLLLLPVFPQCHEDKKCTTSFLSTSSIFSTRTVFTIPRNCFCSSDFSESF